MRRLVPCLLVLALTASLTALTTRQALERYRDLRSGWSWDLAYYNQWLWALTKGDRTITVRPTNPYAEEGPPIWRMSYLSPLRLLIAPIYAAFPGPTTLLVIQNVTFWWLIPAAYMLAKSESRSTAVALSAAALVPATPLLWPLVANDFRELQVAMPFVLWGVQGYRSRHRGLAAVGIGGMLACRQELALVVASLAILPPRDPEDVGRSYRWARAVLLLGLGWLLVAFFGYLQWVVQSNGPEHYLKQFGGPKPPPGEMLKTAWEFLAMGMGAWAAFACLAPRVALLALPWLWSLAGGRLALRYLETEQWHHVRYAAPMVALVLAAGLIGYARLGARFLGRPGGRRVVAAAWLAAALATLAAKREVDALFARAPAPVAAEDVAGFWRWAGQVGPDDGVLAVYPVCAPLSTRGRLYSYVLERNKPRGYPRLGPEFRWVFLRKGDPLSPQLLIEQGFVVVYPGRTLTIFRRDRKESAAATKKFRWGANVPSGRAVQSSQSGGDPHKIALPRTGPGQADRRRRDVGSLDRTLDSRSILEDLPSSERRPSPRGPGRRDLSPHFSSPPEVADVRVSPC